MGQHAGRKRNWRPRIVSLIVALALVSTAAIVVARGRGAEPMPESVREPDVVLQRGTFAGMPWLFGVSDLGHGPCVELAIAAAGPGCGAFRPPVRAIEFYTSSSGDPSGIRTAEGFVSREVASVVTLSGGKVVGEAHVIRLPEPVEGKTTAVVAFVDEAEMGLEAWVAVAFDSRSRVVGHDVIAPG